MSNPNAQMSRHASLTLSALIGLAVLMILVLFAGRAGAQTPTGDWQAGVAPSPGAEVPGSSNTTVIPRTGADPKDPAQPGAAGPPVPVRLVALLTADGQKIDQGLVWRIYAEEPGQTKTKTKLVSSQREASPVVRLPPGGYIVNAAFGRAHLTRKIVVKPATGPTPAIEQFVINAGGLRINAQVSGTAAPSNSVTYAIYSDRDQQDNRKLVMSGAKPGLIIRLNAGIYHVISTYGDANATVKSDVTVEAGKLTEATVAHTAAKAMFKLVTRAGGEALPETQWTIQTAEGDIVKESAGALPTHILAPGSYIATAKSQGGAFQRAFSLKDGETAEVEVMMQ